MKEFKSLPSAISHKELKKLFSVAHQEQFEAINDSNQDSEEKHAFQQLIINWKTLSEELLLILKRKESFLSDGKDHRSIMALGALEAHLNMAIHAQKASE